MTFKGIRQFVVGEVLYQLSLLVPRKRNLCVAGSWFGDVYGDNPRYFIEFLLNKTSFSVCWVGKKHIESMLPHHERLYFVEYGTIKANWIALRAKWLICCQGNDDISTLPVFRGAVCLNLWHGIPLKKMARLSPAFQCSNSKVSHDFGWFLRKLKELIAPPANPPYWTSISHAGMGSILSECFPSYFACSRMLTAGTPRNDFLVSHKFDTELKNQLKRKYASLLGIRPDRKWVLYMPTFRVKSKNGPFTFFALPNAVQTAWRQMLDSEDAVLIEKHHYHVLKNMSYDKDAFFCSTVISAELQKRMDTQELLLASDILITDYSSVALDFSLLCRPCLHFAYDYAEYQNADSGLLYDLPTVSAGPCVFKCEELMGAVEGLLRLPRETATSGCKDLVEYEKGDASQQILAWMQGYGK